MIQRPVRPDILERMIRRGFEKSTSSPENDEYRRIIHKEQLPRVKGKAASRKRMFRDAVEATAHMKEFALANGAARVAICRIDQRWVYEGVDVPYKYGIVLLRAMDYDKMGQAPGPAAGIEATRGYMLLGETTVRVGEHLRKLGYDAMIHHPRGDGLCRSELLFIPHAVSAGLGELGRNGILINYDFGPRVRLGMVSTDLEMVVDLPQEKGIAKFCEYCLKCYRSCPANALPLRKTASQGNEKFTVERDLCAPFFEMTDGCSICIRDCVFNQPTVDRARNIVDRVATWHEIVKANPLWPEIVEWPLRTREGQKT